MYYLSVDNCPLVSHASLLPVLQAHGSHLRMLCTKVNRLRDYYSVTQVEAILAAAPILAHFYVCVKCPASRALQLLRNEPPFQSIRMYCLEVEDATAEDVATLAPALALHPSLSEINWLTGLDDPAAFDSFIDGCITAELPSVMIALDVQAPATAHLAGLARLLRENKELHTLRLFSAENRLISGPGVPLFCDALRDSELEFLAMQFVSLWGAGQGHDSSLLMQALIGHPTLGYISLGGNPPVSHGMRGTAGCQPAALLRAPNSALVELNIFDNQLGDYAMRPFFAAVAASTTLRSLVCEGNDIGAECARKDVYPAVVANTSLRHLSFYDDHVEERAKRPKLVAAERLIASRPPL